MSIFFIIKLKLHYEHLHVAVNTQSMNKRDSQVAECDNFKSGVTHCFLQADLSELSNAAVEQSLQGLLPLLKSYDPLSLQLAVLAALNIYTAQSI